MKVVRNFCKLLLCLFAMLAACPLAGQAANNDQFVALQALNHGLMAVEMVLRQPYRSTVDAQRLAIIEQLDLPASVLKARGKNKGNDNENSLQAILLELNRIFKESGNDADGLAKAREAEEAAVMASLAKVPAKTVLASGSAREFFKPLAKGVMSNGPLGSLLALAENPADHARPLATMPDGPGEKLDQAVIERFASLRKQLLAVRDDFVSKSRLPVREVLTDERLGLFLELADMAGQPGQLDGAMALARKREKELSFWPPFWFYYGKIAQAKGDEGLARRCFRELERRSRGCLKKNTYHAALNLNRIAMLDSEEEAEARRVLEVMNRNLIPADWPKGLVAGLQYYTLGDRRRAEQQFQRNASELKVLVPVHTRLLDLLKQKSFAMSALLGDAGAKTESGKTDQPAKHEQKTMPDQPEKQQAKPAEQLPDTPADQQVAKPAEDPAEKPVAKPVEPEQAGQSADQQDLPASAKPAENRQTEAGSAGQEPADLPVENIQEADGKIAEPASQSREQDRVEANSPDQQKADMKEAPKDEQKADNPGSEKQDRALPASGTIGSRPEAAWYQNDPKAGTSEQGSSPDGQSAGNGEHVDKPDSPEKGTGAGLDGSRDTSQTGSPATGGEPEQLGQAEQGSPENSQAADLDSAANAKDAKALYLLAMSHYRGENGKKDLVRAIMMLTQAAGQGNADAQTQLGFCHYTGNGVAKDKAKAVRYFTQAAEQGNTNAMFNLAVCYHSGDGVEKDIAKAAELYTAAALKGETRSQYNLAMLYFRGEGVEKDVPRARKLLESLSAQGFVPARKAMEYLDNKQGKAEQGNQ